LRRLYSIVSFSILGCLIFYLAQMPSVTTEAAPIHPVGKCQVFHAVHAGHKTYAACLSLVGYPLTKPPTPEGCPETSGKHPVPNCTYEGDCPTGNIHSRAYNTNEAIFSGTVTNNCGFELTGGVLTVDVNIYCPGAITGGGASATSGIGTWPNGVTHSYSYGVVGQCEVCENGVPTFFPQFDLIGELIVYGRNSGNLWINDPADTSDITMANSAAYAFPCPA
jgi:hypothetical protein